MFYKIMGHCLPVSVPPWMFTNEIIITIWGTIFAGSNEKFQSILAVC